MSRTFVGLGCRIAGNISVSMLNPSTRAIALTAASREPSKRSSEREMASKTSSSSPWGYPSLEANKVSAASTPPPPNFSLNENDFPSLGAAPSPAANRKPSSKQSGRRPSEALLPQQVLLPLPQQRRGEVVDNRPVEEARQEEERQPNPNLNFNEQTVVHQEERSEAGDQHQGAELGDGLDWTPPIGRQQTGPETGGLPNGQAKGGQGAELENEAPPSGGVWSRSRHIIEGMGAQQNGPGRGGAPQSGQWKPAPQSSQGRGAPQSGRGRGGQQSGQGRGSPQNSGQGRDPESGGPEFIDALGRTLTKILRHQAAEMNLAMSSDGYVRVHDLLKLSMKTRSHQPLTSYSIDDIKQAVQQDNKQRMGLKDDNGVLFIRANQGHTLETVKTEHLLKPIVSAEEVPVCVHGTYRRHLDPILKEGLKRMTRNHVHFATGVVGSDGVISGMRTSCNVLIYLNVEKALEDGMKLYMSDNKVILTEGFDGVVGPEYFEKVVGLPDMKPISLRSAA